MKTSRALCGDSTEVTACGDSPQCQPYAVRNRADRNAIKVYGFSHHASTPARWTCSNIVMYAMLKTARAGGFTLTDILHTLLARGERSMRVQTWAEQHVLPQALKAFRPSLMT